MCTVAELLTTLHAMDAGKETRAMRECMRDTYEAQKVFTEYVAKFSVVPRRDPNGIWARAGTYDLGELPVYMPLHVPFVVWEISTKEKGVLLQSEYTLTSVGEYEAPHWVHWSSELGTVFDRWFQGKPQKASVVLGTEKATRMAMIRAMIHKNSHLQPRHFLCCLMRRVKIRRSREGGVVVDTPVETKPTFVWCDYVQNNELRYFEDGSETFPFHMKRWMRVDRKDGPWAHFPFIVPSEHWILDKG